MENNSQLDHKQFKRQQTKFPICILANDIHSPENVGSLFRIADAFGVERLYLTGTSPTPPNKKIKKTARSTENYIDFEYEQNAINVLNRLKKDNYLIVSLEITSNSKDINLFKPTANQKICLIIGAESEGINDALLAASDCTVHIPMYGQNSSMNLASAAAIGIYELTKHFL